MAVLFDVVQSSTKFTGENTLLFPWRPQQEGCYHSKRQGSGQGPWHSGNSKADTGVTLTGQRPNISGMFNKNSICVASTILQWNQCWHSPCQFLVLGDKELIKRCHKLKTSVWKKIETCFTKQLEKLQEYLHLPQVEINKCLFTLA